MVRWQFSIFILVAVHRTNSKKFTQSYAICFIFKQKNKINISVNKTTHSVCYLDNKSGRKIMAISKLVKFKSQ